VKTATPAKPLPATGAANPSPKASGDVSNLLDF
jgi:hypothetical protein